jgi:chloride channel protein, CIC family
MSGTEPPAAPPAGDGDGAGGNDPIALLVSRRFLVLLALAAVVGLAVSVVAWGFLELTHNVEDWVYDDLPGAFGFDGGAPTWWPLPVLAIAGALTAVAIKRLPGNGGHVPAEGLNAGLIQPRELPGVLLAAIASIGLGAVVGPEAPLIALGGALGLFFIRTLRRDAPDEVAMVIAASGMFASLTMIFDSALIAAVILIEAAGLGGRRLPVVLVPGMLAAGIGSLVSTGLGAWTGLSNADFAIGLLELPDFARPTAADLAWTIPFAMVVALGASAATRIGQGVQRLIVPRLYVLLPLCGIAVAVLAMIFHEVTGRGTDQVLFSGQEALGPLTRDGGDWPAGDLALLLAFKGLAWGISLGSFRGGPAFPSLLLGAAAGLLAANLPGFDVTAAVAVGMGAASVAVLRLPLACTVLATMLTARSGAGASPLVIVGVIVAYLTTLAWKRQVDARRAGVVPVTSAS